jgi:hypothetical protein
LVEISRAAQWPSDGLAAVSVSRLLYEQQSEEAHLWFAKDDFRSWRREQVSARILQAIQTLREAA